MNQEQALQRIDQGETAYDLLLAADPSFEQRFNKLDAALIKLLKDVRKHFPDAEYYTASGGFNLLIGRSHSDNHKPQQQLTALSGLAQISDGDF